MTHTQELITRSLCLTADEYAEMVFQAGNIWLERLSDKRVIKRVSLLPLFWKWWKNQWEIRDKEFIRVANLNEINQPLSGDTLIFASSLYNDVHDIKALKIIPNAWLNKQIVEIVNTEIEQTEALIKTKTTHL